MKSSEKIHQNSGLSSNKSQKHTAPITAVFAVILLTVSSLVFVFGIFMIRDYIKTTSQNVKTQDNAKVSGNEKNTPELEASVLSTRYTIDDRVFKPGAEMQYVVVDVDVVHRFDAPKWFSPVLETYVTDNLGNKYELSPVMLNKPFDAREYKMNEHATGELSYMIPKDASNLSWCYEVSSINIKSCSNL